MNIRKPIDYSAMYAALDALMAADLPQVKLYSEIGRVISARPEKGAAVMAAEYLQTAYPDATGFSPRNTRRMREFYRARENSPALLDGAMEIGARRNMETRYILLSGRYWRSMASAVPARPPGGSKAPITAHTIS